MTRPKYIVCAQNIVIILHNNDNNSNRIIIDNTSSHKDIVMKMTYMVCVYIYIYICGQ